MMPTVPLPLLALFVASAEAFLPATPPNSGRTPARTSNVLADRRARGRGLGALPAIVLKVPNGMHGLGAEGGVQGRERRVFGGALDLSLTDRGTLHIQATRLGVLRVYEGVGQCGAAGAGGGGGSRLIQGRGQVLSRTALLAGERLEGGSWEEGGDEVGSEGRASVGNETTETEVGSESVRGRAAMTLGGDRGGRAGTDTWRVQGKGGRWQVLKDLGLYNGEI